MTARALVPVLGLLPGLLGLAPLHAQGPLSGLRGMPVPEIGVRGGWDWDAGALVVGGQVRLPMGPGGMLAPSGDYHVTGGGTQWQVNLDLLMPAGPGGLLYAGAGAALTHRRFENYGLELVQEERTKLGLNLLIGVGVPRALPLPVSPYAEVRITTVSGYDASQWIVVGVNVPLGRRPRSR